jgi:hypothetical protein
MRRDIVSSEHNMVRDYCKVMLQVIPKKAELSGVRSSCEM